MQYNEYTIQYLNWMTDIVDDSINNCIGVSSSDYHKLFKLLFEKEFYSNIPMDNNRIGDAMSLRYRFGSETGCSIDDVSDYIDIYPCSLLEMMVSLALRIEEHIMCDQTYGDRTSKWFWEMIINLDLIDQTDFSFDNFECSMIVNNLLEHNYGPNGEGGLFYVTRPKNDLTKTEIWYQANWHFSELIRGEIL